MPDEQPVHPQSPGVDRPPSATPKVIDSVQLFGTAQEVRLFHQGQEYRLRITRQGKLILTK